MGTNYYAIEPGCAAPCAHCYGPQELHICKSLASFQGHRVFSFTFSEFS